MNEPRGWWWIVGGAAFGLVVLPVVLKLLPRAERDDAAPESSGGGARLLAGALGGLLLFGLLMRLASGVEPLTHAAIVLGVNVVAALFLAVFLRAPRAIDGTPLVRTTSSNWSLVVRGAAAYVLLIPATTALNALNLRLHPTGEPVTAEALTVLGHGPLDLRYWLLAAAVVIAVPCFEEVFARGLLQRGLAAELSVFGSARGARLLAVVLASLVFTALHDPPAYVPVFLLSLALGAIAARTGGVAAAIGFHGAHNAFAVAYERWLKVWAESAGLV